MKFGFKALAALAVAGFMSIGTATAAPLTDKDYREIKPAQSTEPGNKVEVIEFFWYGCPHCFTFEPMLESWARRLPPDVAFRQVPVGFVVAALGGELDVPTLKIRKNK